MSNDEHHDRDTQESAQDDGSMPPKWRRVFVMTYATAFMVIFVFWPTALALVYTLSDDADTGIKAMVLALAITWFFYWRDAFVAFVHPFGFLAPMRWMIVWPLHREFGKMPLSVAFLLARAQYLSIMASHHRRRR